MKRVSVQMDLCRRNGTDWCSGKKFTVCTTVDQRADIFDKVFGAGIDVGVNIEQYMWGQRGLSSTARGPIRRQVPEGQVPQGSSPDDGHGM